MNEADASNNPSTAYVQKPPSKSLRLFAEQISRPAQSLAALDDLPSELLDALGRAVENTEQSERDALNAAYDAAIPALIRKPALAWLKRGP